MDPARAAAPALPLRDALLQPIKAALGVHPRRTVNVPERRQAAVLIMLFERDGEPFIVLTKRTETVRAHKGEISFPGGARDDDDEDLYATAVRETHEELGVEPVKLQPLGALDDYPTFSSGYIVSPFVAAVEPGEYAPSEHEIAEVIELPLRALSDAHKVEVWERDGIRFPMHIFDVGGHYVWGVTAFILRRFLDVVGPALGYGSGIDGMSDPAQTVKELAASDDRFDWVGIYWVEGEELVLGPYVGLHPDGHERIRIPESVCGSVARTGETEVVPDVRARPGHIACDLNARSEVVVPIRRNGRVVGVLDVDSNKPDAFGTAEISSVERAAARLGDD